MIQLSKASHNILTKEDRIAALRFMLMLPLSVPFGITALPDYVFTYIYEEGAMIDLPWMTWVEDETGARIYRWRVTDQPRAVYEMSYQSPLFRSIRIDHLLRAIRYEMIGVDKFESLLLKYTRTWQR